MKTIKWWNSDVLEQMSLFLKLHMNHADSRSSCYHSPVQHIPTSRNNTSSSSSLLEICITVHSAGIAGVFQIFPWFFSSFINQLNCHCLREVPPEQPIKSCPFLYDYPVEFLTQHQYYHFLKFFFFNLLIVCFSHLHQDLSSMKTETLSILLHTQYQEQWLTHSQCLTNIFCCCYFC